MDMDGDFNVGIIARLLNVTERRVFQLAKEGIIPRHGRGRYPLAGCVRGYITFLQTSHEGIVNDPDKLKPFERRAFYQGELDKLKLEAERGELVPSFEVEAEMARMFKLITHVMDTLPDNLERDVGLNPQQLAAVEKHLDDAREGMYNLITEPADVDSAFAQGK